MVHYFVITIFLRIVQICLMQNDLNEWINRRLEAMKLTCIMLGLTHLNPIAEKYIAVSTLKIICLKIVDQICLQFAL